MITIIAGSRGINDYNALLQAVLDAPFDITEVVSGGARGVDKLGERLTREYDLPLKIFPANWEMHQKRAGMLRNEQMSEYAEALILIWDGVSKGSKHMLSVAKRGGLKIHIHIVEEK